MRTLEELAHYYKSQLRPDLMVLDEKRVRIKKKLIPLIALSAVIVIFSFGIVVYFNMDLSVMTVPFCICAILISGWYLNFYRDFAGSFKEQVIKKIVVFIDAGLSYDKDKFVSKDLFLESRIFQDRADRYGGDDFVSGRIGKTNIQFSEINVKRVEKTTRRTGIGLKSRIKTNTYPIFNGLFFVGDFNKAFGKKTIVLPDTAERIFGRLGQKLQSINAIHGELIRLEDPEFEKFFVVYGEDQVESRYILSTSLMKRIMDFRNKNKKDIFLSFVASKVFVAIPYDNPLFEPGIFKSMLDFSEIKKYFEDLQVAIVIVEDLNLNMRIWTN
ncbi:MAG: DUF3137 domain-containing protein [Dissulfuribacterales bacterium]